MLSSYNLIPYEETVLVLSGSASEVLMRLSGQVAAPVAGSFEATLERPPYATPSHSFIGQIAGDTFRIYSFTRHIPYFTPEITGRVEDTNYGSLTFLSFKLSSGNRFFISFFCSLCIITALLFLIFDKNYLYFGGGVFTALLYYTMMVYNFKRHAQSQKQLLARLLAGAEA